MIPRRPSPGASILLVLAVACGLGLLGALWLQSGPALAEQEPAGPIPCEEGFAGDYPCDRVDFLAHLSLEELGADPAARAANLWGWTDPLTDREYVIQGMTDTTVFVDVTFPIAPMIVGRLPTHTSSSKYRDVKVYDDHAFIIADLPSEHGMQVFDLTRLRDVITPPEVFTETAHFDGFGNGHNLYINTDTGFAYVARTTSPTLCNGALYIADVQDPANPSFAGCASEGGLASDAICVVYHGPDHDYQGREVCITASDDNLVVSDVTDKTSPTTLATLTYPGVARAHNAWVTADHAHFVSADMNDELVGGQETRIFTWDLSDLENPTLIGTYFGPTFASDHNVWVNGRYAYVGNFRAGLRILDLLTLPFGQVTQAAFFDLYPSDDAPGHDGGAWAVYPYFESGVVAVSEKESGLYLLRPRLLQSAAWLPLLGG